MTRLCRDRNETVAALVVVLVPGVVPAASTNDGAIAAKVRTQAEARAIALRRNCIHASRPKCPLLRIGNHSPSDAAASRPIRSPCSNGAAHFAVATRRHRQPSQAKRLSGSECRREHARSLARRSAAPAQNSVCLFSSTRCAAASDGYVCERENPKARFTRSAPDRSGRTDWPDVPGRCCPGCRPSRTGAPCAC